MKRRIPPKSELRGTKRLLKNIFSYKHKNFYKWDMIGLNGNASLSIKARCYWGLPGVVLQESSYLNAVNFAWEPLLLQTQFFSLGLLDECVHLNLGNALLASNDIKRKKKKKTRGVNHLRSHLTRGCVFIYLSVSVIFPPRKCTFACLSTIRHNTNNPAITGGLSWPLKVSSSTEEWFSNSQVHIGLLSSRGPRKHHYS